MFFLSILKTVVKRTKPNRIWLKHAEKKSINYLFYMDHLQLFSKDENDLEGLLRTVKMFGDDIGMSFGLD